MTKRRPLLYAMLLGIVAIASGCGGKDTAARIRMQNSTAEALTTARASTQTVPGYLGMKVIAIYLGSTVTDTGHVPSETTLWFHPDCLVPAGQGDGSKTLDGSKEAHIARCGIEKGGTASNTEHSTVDLQVEHYIDFARPTAEVNAQLASEALSVRPGTYKYVGIAMGDPGNTSTGDQQDEDGAQTLGSVPSVKFWHADMGGALNAQNKPPLANSVRFKAQKIWYAQIAPVTIEDGDQVEFTLTYDLSQAYWNGADCNDDGGHPKDGDGTTNGKCHFVKLPALTVGVEKKDL